MSTPVTEPLTTPPASPPSPTAPPEPPRPDGVTEAEWSALGDPGKAAIVRERARATHAEQALAAARRPTPRPPPTAPPNPDQSTPAVDDKGQPDLAAIIQRAVDAAIAPMRQADEQREAERAAARITEAVTTAAGTRFHDPTDALTGVDLAALTDGTGRPDEAKITAALDGLLTRKPHLGRPFDGRRHTAPGAPVGATGSGAASLDDRVKAQLALMQQQP